MVVNVSLLIATLVLASKVWTGLVFYPFVGLVVLSLTNVKQDSRLSERASLAKRFDMRLYQAWGWPLVCSWLFVRLIAKLRGLDGR